MKETKNPEYNIHIENLYLRIQFTANPAHLPVMPKTDETPWCLLNLHTHPYFELFFCEAGSLEIKTKSEKIRLLSHDLLIIPPNVEHIGIPPNKNTQWGSIFFAPFKRKDRGNQDVFSLFHRHLTKQEPLLVHQRPDLTLHLQTMLDASKGNHKPLLLAVGIADVLLQAIGSLEEATSSFNKDTPLPRSNVDIDSISRLEVLIVHQYMENLTTNEVAKQFHISARQLDRIAYRRYGTTFRQAVIQHRLRVAIEMFSTTSMTIEEIGIAIGFSSRLSFSRAFSTQYGMSPQQYRKRFC